MKRPALILDYQSWLDEGAAHCSIASQGLWLRMKFLMRESERYGYIIRDGSPIPPVNVARSCGVTTEQYETLLNELLRGKVVQISNEGFIFSSFMLKQQAARAAVLDRVRRFRARLKSGESYVTRYTPVTEKEDEKEKVEPKERAEEKEKLSSWFETIWGRYPKKVGRQDALKFFLLSVKTEEDWARMQTALENYISSRQVREGYIQDGSRWFKAKNWQDWVTYREPVAAGSQAPVKMLEPTTTKALGLAEMEDLGEDWGN